MSRRLLLTQTDGAWNGTVGQIYTSNSDKRINETNEGGARSTLKRADRGLRTRKENAIAEITSSRVTAPARARERVRVCVHACRVTYDERS